MLYRRSLRVAAIAVLLRHGGPMSVPEIRAALEGGGHVISCSPSQRPARVLADALAVEVRRGRLRRVRRGWYEAGRIPSTTRWRILHWEQLHAPGIGWAHDFADRERRLR